MKEIKIIKAANQDMEKILASRYETVRDVCSLGENYTFSEEFKRETEKYYREERQTTVLALDDDKVVGCAAVCYIRLMPTFEHPSGKRAHVMNVHVKAEYRRRGIAYQMMNMLIDDARKNGATELSLDATEEGRMLYEKCGFAASKEGMVLKLNK